MYLYSSSWVCWFLYASDLVEQIAPCRKLCVMYMCELTVQGRRYDPWGTGKAAVGKIQECCHHEAPTTGPCHTTAVASPGCGSGCLPGP